MTFQFDEALAILFPLGFFPQELSLRGGEQLLAIYPGASGGTVDEPPIGVGTAYGFSSMTGSAAIRGAMRGRGR